MNNLTQKYTDAVSWLESKWQMQDLVLLWIRLWIAKIFYDSGRTKSGDSYFEINDFQGTLFEEEYGITFVDPELMAQLALYAETFLPIMLMVGIASRFAALGLMGMTLFIQFFVYPLHFTDHILWFAALLAITAKGAGALSLDTMFVKK